MKKLFTDNFPIVSNNEELNKIKKEYAPKGYDEYYIASGCINDRRKKFEYLWSIYAPYADSHFLDQVKYDFHSRTWEMYLGALFINNNLKIESMDIGPDFKITTPSTNIYVENVVCNKGRGSDAVPEIQYEGVYDVPQDEMLLRLTSSINYKFQEYEKYKKQAVIDKNLPYIIALNRGMLDHPESTPPLIMNCLFALGPLAINMSPNRTEEEPRSFLTRREFIIKKSGKKIPLNFFLDKSHSGISAIIYSDETILNHPQNIGEDCMLVHNPNADNPIDESLFNFINQWKWDNKTLKCT